MSDAGGRNLPIERLIPNLLVRDMDASLAFYSDVLGFRITGRTPDERPPSWAEVSRGGATLWLHTGAPRDTPPEPVMSGTLYLLVDDVEALARDLEGRVPFAWGPEVMPYGLHELAVRDPDGYFLAFAKGV